MSDTQTSVIVLAAGKGTRMKSALPKVMHELAGLPLLGHVLKAATSLGPDEIVTVIGPGMDDVEAYVTGMGEIYRTCVQSSQNGTGDAVKAAKGLVSERAGVALVVFGDTPFITADTLGMMRDACAASNGIVVMGFEASGPHQYGRLVQDGTGHLLAIVEHKDASDDQKSINLCNGGAMAVPRDRLFELLQQLNSNNASGEFYLTDLPAIGRTSGVSSTVALGSEAEVLGINNRRELAAAEARLQTRLRNAAMDGGATLRDPDTTYFSHDTVLGQDVIVGQNVVFGPGVRVADGVTIKPFTHLEGTEIGSGSAVGPYARLRPGTVLGTDVKIGNFVETKKASIEDGAKVSHLSYIGDARIGTEANIGAGTITCNYDGFNKHFTDIGAGAFVGSNSSLVAPIKIGDGGYIGSGSVVTKAVSDDALAVTRAKQVEKEGWAKRFRDAQSKRKK